MNAKRCQILCIQYNALEAYTEHMSTFVASMKLNRSVHEDKT